MIISQNYVLDTNHYPAVHAQHPGDRNPVMLGVTPAAVDFLHLDLGKTLLYCRMYVVK